MSDEEKKEEEPVEVQTDEGVEQEPEQAPDLGEHGEELSEEQVASFSNEFTNRLEQILMRSCTSAISEIATHFGESKIDMAKGVAAAACARTLGMIIASMPNQEARAEMEKLSITQMQNSAYQLELEGKEPTVSYYGRA